MANMQTTPAASDLRVLVVDDHTLLCDTLVAAWEDGNIRVEIAGTVDEASRLIAENGRYDVVLLDYDVPGMKNLTGLGALLDENKGGVALFSGVASWSVVERAVQMGAAGFVPKSLSLKILAHAIRMIADGAIYLPAEYMMNSVVGGEDLYGLKQRERRVLGFLCEGLPNKEIGRHLGIEETIVKMDVKSICRKLGARNRTQAVIEAQKKGLF
jgi:two-component system, NarL family, nitrate/nitrite response regulator NarL